MKLSVVVTTKNRKDVLLRCVASIGKSTFQDYELIVVDDCSSDGTERLDARALGVEPCEIYHAPTPLMMVKARNVGAKRAQGEYVLFVDDDNVVDEAMMGELVTAADAHPDYGILGPSMYCLGENRQYLNHQRINLFTSRTMGLRDPSDCAMVDSDGIPNVFMIRKRVFERCGYFDEALVQTYTEPDFALAARSCGFKCGIVKAAKTYHDVPSASAWTPRGMGGNYTQKAYCLMRNRTVIVARYGRWYHRLTYGMLFAWVWPVMYSALMLRYKRFDLVKLYWFGFLDGMIYLVTGHLRNSLPRLLRD